MHTGVAFVIALSTLSALLAVRTTIERTEHVTRIEHRVELLEELRESARELGKSGRRYLLSGDGKEQQRVLAIEEDLNQLRVEVRKLWPGIDSVVDAYTFSVVRSMSRERPDVLAALIDLENELLAKGNALTSSIDEHIADELANKQALRRNAQLVDTSQWLLVVAAFLAIGLLIASASTVTGAFQRHREDRQAIELRAKRSAVESEAVSLRKELCNVSVLINDAIRAARPSALEQGIRLRFDTPLGYSVPADRARLGATMSSLLAMQIASATEGTLIAMGTAQVGDAVQFTLTADYVADMVGTSFRAPFPLPGDTRLLAAERVIEAHGGQLLVDRTPVGVAIHFTIPTAGVMA